MYQDRRTASLAGAEGRPTGAHRAGGGTRRTVINTALRQSPTRPLHRHGIQTEAADTRIHVCAEEGFVYVFTTSAAKAAVREAEANGAKLVAAYQEGIPQACGEGYLISPASIEGCRRVPIPADLRRPLEAAAVGSTSDKGRAAEQVVEAMLRRGLIPLPTEVRRTSRTEDLAGVDLAVNCTLRLQVKYDGPGGIEASGNLYLQIAEANPLKRW